MVQRTGVSMTGCASAVSVVALLLLVGCAGGPGRTTVNAGMEERLVASEKQSNTPLRIS